jgi:hypothetical protein
MHGKSFAAGVAAGVLGLLLLKSLTHLFLPLLVIVGIIVVAYVIFGGGRNERPPA